MLIWTYSGVQIQQRWVASLHFEEPISSLFRFDIPSHATLPSVIPL